MKITVDLTPEEFKELFVPSEKQTEFGTQLYQEWMNTVQKHTEDMAKSFYKQFDVTGEQQKQQHNKK